VLGLAITAGAIAVVIISALVYRLTPQPSSPYLVGNTARKAAGGTRPGTGVEVVMPERPSAEDAPIPIVANESPEQTEARRLKEERRIEERNIAEQRQLEDKKKAIERQIEDKKAEEKRRLEDKALEDARIAEDKKLIEAREAEDKRLEDERRLQAEREEAARKLASSQP
jgi:type IV secretory pathway VirB10-like protein